MFELEDNHLPNHWKVGDRWRLWWVTTRFIILVILVGGFHIGVIIGISVIPFMKPLTTSQRLTLTSLWATLLLTFALITVYRDIGENQQRQTTEIKEQRQLQEELINIQESQSEILDKQNEIISQEYQPIIRINEWDIDNNRIQIWLSNLGNGLANDIGLEIYLEPRRKFGEGLDEIDYRPLKTPLYRASTKYDKSLKGVLREGEKNIEFSGQIMAPNVLPYTDGVPNLPNPSVGVIPTIGSARDFGSWWDQLETEEYESIITHLSISCETLIGSKESAHITTLEKPVESINSAGDLVDEDSPHKMVYYNPRFVEGL